MTAIALVDSGGANIASLRYAFQRLGADATLTRTPDVIRNASHVVLPGVGAAASAMKQLLEAELVDVIRNLRQPVLGICLGLQLLCEGSEEEDVECLGVIPGIARKMVGSPTRPVPNMGWCQTSVAQPHPLFSDIDNGAHFYFLHSFALPVTRNTIATAEHDGVFSAAMFHNNVVAAQFHPERSSTSGNQLLQNFLAMTS